MEPFLNFLAEYRTGIFILFAIVAFIVFLIQWLAWIFKWGRFKDTQAKSRQGYTTRDVVFNYLATLASDFKFVLATLIFGIFAVVLIFALNTQSDFASALQAVMSTLGGLVGTIVGYFFGEKAGQSESNRVSTASIGAGTGPASAQSFSMEGANEVAEADMEEIEPVTPPPSLLNADE